MAAKSKKNRTSFVKVHFVVVFVSIALVLLVSIPLLLAAAKNLFPQKPLNPYHKEKLAIIPGSHYVAHQLLIKYVDGDSPEELKAQIAAQNTPQGIIDSIGRTITNKKPLQQVLQEIKNTLLKAGVTTEQPTFSTPNPVFKDYYSLTLSPGTDIAAAQKILNASDFIDFAHPNYEAFVQDTPNDQYYSAQWNLQKIQMNQAWDISHGSNSVIVSVIDTGLAFSNPDFAGRNVLRGHDYFAQVLQQAGQNIAGYDYNDSTDHRGHGTHVAGIIGAATNNGIGVAGVNWNVTLMINKVCGNDDNENPNDVFASCPTSAMANAIADSVDAGAKVINMSLAGAGSCYQDPSLPDAINYAQSKGVLVVVASGNNAVDASTEWPASCGNTFVVGATGPNDERAPYSDYGATVSIAAPGGDPLPGNPPICTPQACIYSTYLSPAYQYEAGTSMSSPHVAGVAALLLAQNPSLSPSQLESCMVQGGDPIATDLPIGGRRLNAYGALAACRNVTGAPTATVTPIPTVAQATPTQSEPQTTPAPLSFTGIIFLDNNKNLLLDSGDTPYGGVQVTLTGPTSQTKFTGSDGTFSFTNLTPGSYSIAITIQSVQNRTYGPYGPFQVTNNSVSLQVPIPPDFSATTITPQITVVPTQALGTAPTATPTPINSASGSNGSQTPANPENKTVILYDCKQETQTEQAGKQVQLSTLVCTPL